MIHLRYVPVTFCLIFEEGYYPVDMVNLEIAGYSEGDGHLLFGDEQDEEGGFEGDRFPS
jgi:hypothetical protein